MEACVSYGPEEVPYRDLLWRYVGKGGAGWESKEPQT